MKRCKPKQAKVVRSFLYRYPLLFFFPINICYSTDKNQIFYCYTGTSYADIARITNENLYTDEEGSLWLKYRRKKTDFQARVKLLPEAIALLDKYKDENRESLFPIQSAEVVQLNMRGLRIMADIKQPISYHSGRHSFASLITLEEGVPKKR